MINFLSKKYIFISLGVIVVGVLVFVFVDGNGNGNGNLAVERGSISQKVKVTGKVKAFGEVDLGFDAAGRIARSFTQVGDRVEAGATIATLDLAEINSNLTKELAILDQELAKLEEVKGNAPASLDQARSNLIAAMMEGYSAMDNAVRNKADQFFKTPRSNPLFEISITDGNFVHYFPVSDEIKMDLNNTRKTIEITLNKWQEDLSLLNNNNVATFASGMVGDMNIVSNFLDQVSLAVNSFTPSEYSYETTVTGYKTSIDSARSALATARGKIISAQQSLSSSPVLGSTGVISSVALQEAKVAQARSSVAALEASIKKSSIMAPFSGIITKQDAKIGETAKVGEPLVSLISPDVYIEANVSEINIGKVAIGNKARLEFDAFPGLYFNGTVSFIEPGETIVDNVVNYKVRIISDGLDEKVKNGLTANVEIETFNKDNVLVLPIFAIIKEGEKSYVNKIQNGEAVKTEISIGAVSSNGVAEIISGLSEGDMVQQLKSENNI